MGWYRVIKTINGRKYLYEQRSWRVGSKVKTQSVYLGKVDDFPREIRVVNGKLTVGGLRKQNTPGTAITPKSTNTSRQVNTLISLEEFEQRNPAAYEKLTKELKGEYQFHYGKIRTVLGGWKRDVDWMVLEMERSGDTATFKKYNKQARLTETKLISAERKMERLKDPRKIEKQKRIIKECQREKDAANWCHAQAMWLRIFMLEKNPYQK